MAADTTTFATSQSLIRDLRITILVDNTATDNDLLSEHGLAVWIKADNHHILFDTGQGIALEHNIKRLGVSLQAVDAVALSHGHDDHTGGLPTVLAQARDIPIYLHRDALSPKYSPRGYIGISSASRHGLQTAAPRRLMWTDKPTEIVPSVCGNPMHRC